MLEDKEEIERQTLQFEEVLFQYSQKKMTVFKIRACFTTTGALQHAKHVEHALHVILCNDSKVIYEKQ